MQPVRKVLSATHFKPVQPDPDSAIIKWTPCSPGDADAVEKSWTQVESDELQEPPLHFTDFIKSLESVRPTVTQEDIRKHEEWTKESGELSSRADVLFWLTNEIEPSGADGA
jgi:vacuolar protein-sorting-associated protein 4